MKFFNIIEKYISDNIILAFSTYSSTEYDNLNNLSIFINKYLNYLIYLYFIGIIIVILIPNHYKKQFINSLIYFMNTKIVNLMQ